MEKIKAKTAVGRFLEQLPSGFEQQITLNTKNNSAADKTGESLLFSLPSGKKVKFIAKLVDPKKCRIWQGNTRIKDFLNAENTQELREKIKVQGQLVPVLARPIRENAEFSHEIIYGSRRHYVCSELGIDIKLFEADLDDHDSLIFMEAENSGRKDLSPYEMAVAYKFWVDNGIFKNQGELSERLGITRSWLNKTLSLSKIPQEIISAIGNPGHLNLKTGLEIIRILGDNPNKQADLLKKTKELQEKGVTGEKMLEILLGKNGNKEDIKQEMQQSVSKTIFSKEGNPICKITNSKQGKTILTFNSKIPRTTMVTLLSQIETFIKQGL